MAVTLGARDLARLREAMSGQIVTPHDAAYEDARRVWNGDIDRRPAAIARCATTADVRAALAFARENAYPIAVRSGGHSFPGHSTVDDGIVIDLRQINAVTVDPQTRRAVVGGGAVWSEVDAATLRHGLVVTGGHVSHTGVAGLTLGGGLGHLMRSIGLTSDSLMSSEVMTADGRLVKASLAENGDLFWAIRGGGGNFGIATQFEFQLHPINEPLYAGMLFYAPEAGPELMRLYNEFCGQAPDEVSTIFAYLLAPPFPFVPESVRFTPGYGLVVVATDQGVAERSLGPLREFGPPLFEMLAPTPYAAIQTLFDAANPPGTKGYIKSQYFDEYSEDIIAMIHANTAKMPHGPSQMLNVQLGGKVARVPEDSTAFGGRSAGFLGMFFGVWEDVSERETCVAWARQFSAAIEPLSLGHTYMNLTTDETEERLRASYGSEKLAKLARVKAKYDPDNVFRLNHNIRPA